MTDRGLHIALIGMDGLGKTSLSRLLCQQLEASGIAARRMNWRDEMGAQTRSTTRSALRQLWVESFRLIYLGAPEGLALPSSYEQFAIEDWEDRLVDMPVESNVPAGPLTAAWLEWVGQVLLYHEVVRPVCSAGTWVIEDSPGLRIMYKEILLARALARGSDLEDEIEHALSTLVGLFRRCAPDVGVVFSGRADLAYRWRLTQSEQLGTLEDMGAAAGAKGWAGFEAIQMECDDFFHRIADEWGWTIFEVEEQPAEQNFARLWQQLREHPTVAVRL